MKPIRRLPILDVTIGVLFSGRNGIAWAVSNTGFWLEDRLTRLAERINGGPLIEYTPEEEARHSATIQEMVKMIFEGNSKCATCKGKLVVLVPDGYTRCPDCMGTGYNISRLEKERRQLP